jgi:hypothetical protein
MSFTYDPTTGLLDINTFPSDPASETVARQQFMTLFNQLKDYLNDNDDYSKTDHTHASLAVSGTLAAQGSVDIPVGSSKFIVKWGETNVSNGGTTITFSTAFPNNCVGVFPTVIDVNPHYAGIVSKGATSVILKQDYPGGSLPVNWIAIGY